MANDAVGPNTTIFSVSGMRNGSPVAVSWHRGTLSGDPPTVDLVEVEVELALTALTDPLVVRSASSSAPAHVVTLDDPQDALALVRRVFDRVFEVKVGTEGG